MLPLFDSFIILKYFCCLLSFRGSEGIKTDDTASSNFLDDIFTEDDDSYLEDISDSDGFLSEVCILWPLF